MANNIKLNKPQSKLYFSYLFHRSAYIAANITSTRWSFTVVATTIQRISSEIVLCKTIYFLQKQDTVVLLAVLYLLGKHLT